MSVIYRIKKYNRSFCRTRENIDIISGNFRLGRVYATYKLSIIRDCQCVHSVQEFYFFHTLPWKCRAPCAEKIIVRAIEASHVPKIDVSVRVYQTRNIFMSYLENKSM